MDLFEGSKVCTVKVNIPSEVLQATHMKVSDAATFAKKMAALGYYTKKNVSIGYCAQIADLTEEEFIALLGQNHIDLFHFESDEELMRDISNA